ncbi:MAG: IspD/TarI family cytidylyltransferase, partial [Clostridia bacterium]|nr:IspD/TarI family cytidylyltransferase [Clostridia bacterium]
MINGKSCWAVVVAAGRGVRTGLDYNKAFYRIDGKSVLSRSLEALEKSGLIDGFVVVLSKTDVDRYGELCREEGNCPLVKRVAFGGENRQRSVYNGLLALPEGVDIVAIHDAARCFVTVPVVKATIESAFSHGSGVAATPLVDTIKAVDANRRAVETLDRSRLMAVQTPQTFDCRDILRAHEQALKEGFVATDDAALYEKYIAPSRLV